MDRRTAPTRLIHPNHQMPTALVQGHAIVVFAYLSCLQPLAPLLLRIVSFDDSQKKFANSTARLWAALVRAPSPKYRRSDSTILLLIHPFPKEWHEHPSLSQPGQPGPTTIHVYVTMVSRRQRRVHLLSSTRPHNIKPTPSLSSHTTRTLIRTHHTFRKQLSSALANRNDIEAQNVRAQIEAAGGLAKYQQASIHGQSVQRGGDTSKVLVEWLSQSVLTSMPIGESREKLKMLEVGSLRTDNACSKSGLLHVTRIDLHSQHPEIK